MPTEMIVKSDLQPADVLLYRGNGALAWLIQRFDGSDVNHAGVYLGVESGKQTVGEALNPGVIKTRLDDSVKGRDYVWVRRLTNTAPMDPVITVGQRYLSQGQRYAYEQLLLMAFLALTRKIKVTPILSQLLRGILDKAASVLVKLTSGGREPMICSEFVYRCFDEADPAEHDVYSIRIDAFAARASSPAVPRAAVTGRGIHPDSLLARRAIARTRDVNRIFAPAPAPTRPRAAKPPSDKALEEMAGHYLEELRTSRAASPDAPGAPTSLTEPDVLRAVDDFAKAWAGAVAKSRGRVAAASFANALDLLNHAAANFVTPGDLIRSNSLTTEGKLEI